MLDEVNLKRWFREVSEKSGKRIEESDAFVSIFTTNYEQNPQCALELGIAIMLDKPIYLLVEKGTPIPSNLKKVANGIEFCDRDDPDGIRKASNRLAVSINKGKVSRKLFGFCRGKK